ncbi:S8 family serine peptidase [Akkermansiaceae bacterium]|nr:S8 family serine peptidase [Akkermansiaceae bacterium]
MGHFRYEGEVFSRTLHDMDGDGWCDLWCSMFPEILRDKRSDLDGDGMTDYEEMILMQNPISPNHFPRKLTALEKEALKFEQDRKRALPRLLSPKEAEEQRRGLALFIEARKNHNPLLPSSKLHRDASRELVRDFQKIADLEKTKPEAERKKLQRSRMKRADRYGADLIRADQLWAAFTGDPLGANGADPPVSSGKPPLPPIGVWYLGGVDLLLNPGLSGRLLFGDLETPAEFAAEHHRLKNDPHSILISKIIALDNGGVGSRGVAWSSTIKNFTLENDYVEMLEESVENGMLFSNHSYSPPAGWHLHGSIWTWLGPPDLAGDDPEFGAYSLDAKSIDAIIYRAETYLSVHSAGNDANNHGPTKSDGTIDTADSSYLYSNYRAEYDENGYELIFLDTPTPPVYHPSDGGFPMPSAFLPENTEAPLEFYASAPIGLGLGTIKSTGSAKNNLTIGSILADAFAVTSSENLWLSIVSSRGPTDDGRLKPDLVAPGLFEFPGYVSSQYGSTSVAAATTTGLLAQLNEINVDGCGPPLLASSWKALLMNTAIDGRNLKPFVGDEVNQLYTRVNSYLGPAVDGADLEGPDPFFGYGMPDAEAAADLLRKNNASLSGRAHLRQHLLFDPSNNTTDSDNLTIEIPIEHDGVSPEIRVMLCWTDPPFQATAVEKLGVGFFDPDLTHSPDFNPRLVNDLDLRVINPANVELFPWAPDFSAPLASTPTGDNSRDNVEQIIIPAPVPGIYTIQITHKDTLKSWEKVGGSPAPDPAQYQPITGKYQAFSLVTSGNLDPEPTKISLQVSSVDFQAGGDLVTLSLDRFSKVIAPIVEKKLYLFTELFIMGNPKAASSS